MPQSRPPAIIPRPPNTTDPSTTQLELGSGLTAAPFNRVSKQDAEAFVDYIYSTLRMDLNYVLLFAVIPESGREIGGLDDRFELAHRMKLFKPL